MNKNNIEIKDLIVDGETFLNRWTGLERLMETRIFLSASNFLYAKVLLAKTLEILVDKKKQYKEYTKEHALIMKILESKEINDCFNEFLDSNDTYMCNIDIVPKNKLYLTIYKGFQLNKEDGVDLSPIVEEVFAYALYKKEVGEDITLYSMSDEIIEFNQDFNIGLDIKDGRKQ